MLPGVASRLTFERIREASFEACDHSSMGDKPERTGTTIIIGDDYATGSSRMRKKRAMEVVTRALAAVTPIGSAIDAAVERELQRQRDAKPPPARSPDVQYRFSYFGDLGERFRSDPRITRNRLDVVIDTLTLRECLSRFTNEQRRDGGVSDDVRQMTHREIAAARDEWSRQVREKVAASAAAARERERTQVVVDYDDW